MRQIEASAYFGIMRSTINNEEPLVTVTERPFSGKAFDDYIWFRVSVELPIQPDVGQHRAKDGELEEITEHPDG